MSTLTTGLLTSFNVLSNQVASQGSSDLTVLSDRQLADRGIDRGALKGGFIATLRKAVVESIRAITGHASAEHQEYLRAVRELESCSDAELADLGLARSNIREAVRHGRPGIDKPAKIIA